MALPTNYDTVTVKGAYVNLDGTPANGSVSFAANVQGFLKDTGADVVVVPGTITASLDGQGTFSIQLPATDDTDISPTGFTYTVTEKLSTGSRTYSIAVPSASTTVDLVTVAPVQAVTASVQLIPAPPSPSDGQVLTWSTTAGKWVAADPTGGGAVDSVNGQTGAVTLTAADVGALAASSNLSDLASAATARTNLGLGSAATSASTAFDAAGAASAAQTAAAADATSKANAAQAAAIAASAQRAANLSDLADAATARTNLGLGTAATAASTAFDAAGAAATAQSNAEAASLAKASNLSDVANAATALANLGGLSSADASATYVALAGSTMTGALTLPADPTTALEAATKQYVDNNAGTVDTSQMIGAAGPYTTTVPTRPTGFAFVLWNGTTDPGASAVDGDIGVGW